LVALGYLFVIFLGIIKSAINESKNKNNQNKKSTINTKKEPHPEYPEKTG
jgi:hypothetical protein